MENIKYNLIVKEKDGKITKVPYFNEYLMDKDDVINYILDRKVYQDYDVDSVSYSDDESKYHVTYDEIVSAFIPEFYSMNLVNGYSINKRAVEKLYKSGYTNDELIKIKNYDEIGLVEFVADDDFTIKDDKIIKLED